MLGKICYHYEGSRYILKDILDKGAGSLDVVCSNHLEAVTCRLDGRLYHEVKHLSKFLMWFSTFPAYWRDCP